MHFHRLLSSGGTNKAFVDEVSAVRAETVLAALAAVLSALVSVYLIGFLISVFVYYPWRSVHRKLFINCRTTVLHMEISCFL